MIFVKETRPKIVTANPNMGALEVMQEVGRAWQNMTEDDRKYFKDKADNDKHRYLAESRKFYDEVARIGIQNTAEEAERSAAASISKAAAVSAGKNMKGSATAGSSQMMMEDSLAGKKRLANAGIGRKGSMVAGASQQ